MRLAFSNTARRPTVKCVQIVGLATWIIFASCVQAQCPPLSMEKTELARLKKSQFLVADDANPSRDALAIGLLDCLASPDPFLRDEVAFEALSAWLRGNQLSTATQQELFERLLPQIASDIPDKEGFRRPFAALVLAELARADRKQEFLSDMQSAQLVEAASAYLESVRDYRGFDERNGWRHGIAHGSDLLMQLSLNPRLAKADLERILRALSSQIAPENGHFYTYGEPERLARPLMFAASRGVKTAEEWRTWFSAIAAIPSKGSLFASESGLSRRHNLQSLLLVLYFELNESKDAKLRAVLLQPVVETLATLK